MKQKLIIRISLINILCLLGFYWFLIKPVTMQYKKRQAIYTERNTSALQLMQHVQALKKQLKKTNRIERINNNLLFKLLSNLAKQQQLTIRHVGPLNTDNSKNQSSGASLVLTGSYSSALIFISQINQLPYFLNLSFISIIKMQKLIELTIYIQQLE